MKKQLDDTPEVSAAAPAAGTRAEDVAAFKDDLMAIRRGATSKALAQLPQHLAVRVTTLFGLLALGLNWLQRQMAWSFEEILGTAAVVLGGYTFAVPLAHYLVRKYGKVIEEGLTELMRRYFAVLLQTRVLAALAAVTLIPSLFFSTVTVVAAGVSGPRSVLLYSPDGVSARRAGRLENETAVEVFNVATTLLGRPFTIKVEGFQHETLDVLPGIGSQISLRNLTSEPSVFLRLPPGVLGRRAIEMGEGGQIKLFVTGEDGRPETLIGATATRPLYGGYVFGWFRGMTGSSQAWGAEMKFEEDLNGDAVTWDRTTVEFLWRQYLREDLLPGTALPVGRSVSAFYMESSNEPILLRGRREFVVTSDPIQDVMLWYVPNRSETGESEQAVGAVQPMPEVAKAKGDARETLLEDETLRSALHTAVVIRLPFERVARGRFQEDERGELVLERGAAEIGSIETSPGTGTYVFGVGPDLAALSDGWVEALPDEAWWGALAPWKGPRELALEAWSESGRSNYIDDAESRIGSLEDSSLRASYFGDRGRAELLATAEIEIANEAFVESLLVPTGVSE